MQISVLSNNTDCRVVKVDSFEELSDFIANENYYGWSPGIFKDNYRSIEKFISTDLIALDIDEGMTLEEACLVFGDYRHIIGTSRSHQKEKIMKSGKIKPASDRFRVVLALDAPITNEDDFKATFNALRTKFPALDPQCSDCSRFFYPCAEIIQGSNEGIHVQAVKAQPKPDKPKRELTANERGKLARSTLEFITVGTVGDKGRHASLFKAAKDLQEQGFDEGDTLDLLLRCPLVDEPGLPAKDFEKAVKSAFRKEPKYEPRTDEVQTKNSIEEGEITNKGSLESTQLLEEALAHLANPEAVKGVSTGWKEIDALLGGLRQSELGILQAYPKSGKTVFLTNLMANLTAQGHKVGFASLEMHPAKQVEPDLYSILLKKDIRKGITDEDKSKLIDLLQSGRGLTYFKRDRRPTTEEICDWARRCYFDKGIRFFFFDHFHKFVPDESSTASIAKTITALTGLKYECPEMSGVLIVQPTKEQRSREGLSERVGKNSLRGGAVIFDECDWLINMHTKYNTHREIQNSWGWKREYINVAYPNDIRELEFEAIRAKPFSENMGKKLYMKYDKATTQMSPFNWIAPDIEKVYMPDEEDNTKYYNNSNKQSGWAKSTWDKKRV